MKKLTATILLVCLLFSVCLVGCETYTSSYNAVGFVHSNESHSAFMTFYQLEGTMVFKLRSGDYGTLAYSGKLESGDITVYYDCGGGKTELFALGSGDEIEWEMPLDAKGTVYIIVETDGICENGDFHFSVE